MPTGVVPDAARPSGGPASGHGPHPPSPPPLAVSTVGADGVSVFDLTPQAGRTDFGTREATAIWGATGRSSARPGPARRGAARGERVRVDVHNTLPEETTLHRRGMHLPAETDGGSGCPPASGPRWSCG